MRREWQRPQVSTGKLRGLLDAISYFQVAGTLADGDQEMAVPREAPKVPFWASISHSAPSGVSHVVLIQGRVHHSLPVQHLNHLS